MTKPFYAEPILNSPYLPPTRHHALGEDGQPLEHPPIEGRRRSKYVTPVPKARRSRPGSARKPGAVLRSQNVTASRAEKMDALVMPAIDALTHGAARRLNNSSAESSATHCR